VCFVRLAQSAVPCAIFVVPRHFLSCWTIATKQYVIIATLICILTAFSVVPQNLFILRCCFSHLKNSSTNHLFL
jgi:hypothetical protein